MPRTYMSKKEYEKLMEEAKKKGPIEGEILADKIQEGKRKRGWIGKAIEVAKKIAEVKPSKQFQKTKATRPAVYESKKQQEEQLRLEEEGLTGPQKDKAMKMKGEARAKYIAECKKKNKLKKAQEVKYAT